MDDAFEDEGPDPGDDGVQVLSLDDDGAVKRQRIMYYFNITATKTEPKLKVYFQFDLS